MFKGLDINMEEFYVVKGKLLYLKNELIFIRLETLCRVRNSNENFFETLYIYIYICH